MTKKLKITIFIVGVAVLAAAVGAYSIHWGSVRARAADSAAASLEDFNKAQTAFAADGSKADVLAAAQSSLSQAQQDMDSASFLNLAAYGDATDQAGQVQAAVGPLLDQLRGEYQAAQDALQKQDYQTAFAFWQRHPQTDEAAALLADSEGSPFETHDSLSDGYSPPEEQATRTLERVYQYDQFYPKADKPQSVAGRAGDMLVDDAYSNLTAIKFMVDEDSQSAQKLASTHERQHFNKLADKYVNCVNRTNELLPGLGMPPEMAQLYAAVAETNSLAQQADAVLQSPDHLLTDYDISRINDLLTQESQKKDEAVTLLQTVQDKYFKGTEANKIGVNLGCKIARQAQGVS